MFKTHGILVAAALAAAFTALVAGGVQAQSKGGKIVCWKDKAGKVVGCGDAVPPEFQDNATKELDRGGVTRKVTETAEERAKREALDKEQAAQKAEEKKRRAEQSRQDAALISTFTNEKEIDLKRDRDLQVADTQLTQYRVQHKNAIDRETDFKGRAEASEKNKKPVPEYIKEEISRAQADKAKAEQGAAAKEKEKEEIRKRYAEMRERYILLKGGGPAAPVAAAAPAPTPVPTKK
jgi:hypothetical protein